MLSMFKQLWKDEEGPTAVEYALMVALIALVIIGSVTLLGGNVDKAFKGAADKIVVPAS